MQFNTEAHANTSRHTLLKTDETGKKKTKTLRSITRKRNEITSSYIFIFLHY